MLGIALCLTFKKQNLYSLFIRDLAPISYVAKAKENLRLAESSRSLVTATGCARGAGY
jgi:hypothetical protein